MGWFSKGVGLPAAMAIAGLVAPGVASAQGMPGGSYSHTCQNLSYVDGVLSGTCQTANGGWNNTQLNNAGDCSNGVVNSDGQLACASPPPQMTSANGAGTTNLTNPCGNEQAVYVIRPGQGASMIAVFVNSGDSVKINVLQGATYVSACGTAPDVTSVSDFKYFTVAPIP